MYKEYLLSLPDIKEVTVKEVGLIVDKENDVLAASPDRIATIVYANGDIEHRNVKIKCLESKQDMSPEAAIKGHQKESSFPVMETNSFFVVKEKHKYWFQTQMQMGVSGIPLTDFVIFTNVTFPDLVLKITHVQYCRTDTDRYLQLTVRKFCTDRHSYLRTVICG